MQDARDVCALRSDAGVALSAEGGAPGTDGGAALVDTATGLAASARVQPASAALTSKDAGVASDAGAPLLQASPAASAPLTTPADPALAGYRVLPTKLEPVFENLPAGAAPSFSLGRDATSAFTVEDATSGVSARVKLQGTAAKAAALGSDGHLVYADALGAGEHVFARASSTSVEDSVLLPVGSTRSELVYDVTLGARVAGLRLVANSLELLDAKGSPRLRVEAPKITDASCTERWATLSVEGCAVDTSAAPPWGRAVTAPGASSCRLRVAWTLADLTLPAVVDPTWSYTNTMGGGVWGGHEAVVLADGNVMVAGNSGGGAPANSVRIYSPSLNQWTNTGLLTTGRYFHSLTRLQDGTVLAAGGIATATGVTLASAERWSPTSGAWSAAGSMSAARARHAAEAIVVNGSGAVLVAGSDSGGGVTAPPPERFTPPTSWAPTTNGSTGVFSRVALTSLSDGRVVQTGGRGFYWDDYWSTWQPYATSTVRIYAPATNAWTDVVSSNGQLKHARFGHAAVLVGTKLLLAGGTNGTALSSAELWDPAGPTSTLVNPMATARAELSLSLDNLGAPLVHGSGWSSGGTVERFNTTSNAWASAPGLTGGGWFYFGRTRLLPNGLTMSFGVNATSAFSPTQVATLGRACPTPLPAATTCMTAGVCDGNGNYTPPQQKPNACCSNGVPKAFGTFCTSESFCQGRDFCDGGGGCTQVPTFPVGTDCSPSPCVAGTCGADAGCLTANRPAGSSCSNGDSCGGARVCAGDGGCLPGTPLPAGTPCVTDGGCRMDFCGDAGTCMPGNAFTPDDRSACTDDACGTAVGSSTWNGTCSTPPNVPAGIPNRGMATSLGFLYEGAGASQQGVTATIDPKRISVVRGRVMKKLSTGELDAASGVTVKVVGRPELGTTVTRVDGWFDFALNGGERHVIELTSSTMLPVQRVVAPRTHDWTVLDDVVQTTSVPAVSGELVVGGAEAVIVGATAGTDQDGPRTARLYFPAGTHVVDKQGSTLVQDGLKVCFDITEYTADAFGPRRMPGELPATSGYTYALDLTMRGPIAAGAACSPSLPVIQDPHFQTDAGTYVSLWIDNFLGLAATNPQVPTGVYDRTTGVWRAEATGSMVLKSALPNSIPLAERTRATTFPGTSFMRVPITHFSDYDTNWGIGPPDDATKPEEMRSETFPPCSKTAKGSIIGCDAQTLGESIPLTGTPFSLEYRSHRARGYKTQIRIPLVRGVIPTSQAFLGVDLNVDIAGRRFSYSFGKPTPFQTYAFEWDGLDAYGRPVSGTQRVGIQLGYAYRASQLVGTPRFGSSPARGGGALITGFRQERRIVLWTLTSTTVSRFDAKEEAKLGGWTLSGVDRLDLGEAIAVEQGDGERREIAPLADAPLLGAISEVTTLPNMAGNERIRDVLEAGDGTVYIATTGVFGSNLGRVFKRDPAGTLTVIAGQQRTVTTPSAFDGALANEAAIRPTSLAFALDGSLLVSDYTSIWRIEASTGRLRHVAGQTAPFDGVQCTTATCGDNGPATAAKFAFIAAMVMSPEGTLYVADSGQSATVRRIGPEGLIDTFYNTNSAAEATRVARLDLQDDGTLFGRLWDNTFVDITGLNIAPTKRKVGNVVYTSDGPYNVGYDEPVAVLSSRAALVGAGHGLYLNASGTLTRLAGGWQAHGLVVRRTPRREVLFVLGDRIDMVRRLALPLVVNELGATVPSADGSSRTTFNLATGWPIQTVSGERGAFRWGFGFDNDGRIASVIAPASMPPTAIAPKPGDPNTIEITAPGGKKTTLGLDPVTKYLVTVTHPDGKVVTVSHRADGLLERFVDERGNVHRFDYNAAGRLVKDTDARPSSPGQSLVRQDQRSGFDVTLTSAEARAVTHGRRYDGLQPGDTDPGGIDEYRFTKRGNLLWKTYLRADKSFWSTEPDGSYATADAMLPDPQWGMATAFPSTTLRSFAPTLQSAVKLTRTLGSGDAAGNLSRTTQAELQASGVTGTRTSTMSFDAPAGRWVTTSAQGRVLRVLLDAHDRPSRVELGTAPFEIEPVEYGYDDRGRLETVTQGQRLWKTTYDGDNFPVTVSSPGPTELGASAPTPITTKFLTRDGRGRPLTIELPGGRVVEMSYDDAGNVSTLRTPAGHLHGFSYDGNDRLSGYTAPAVPGITNASVYARDFDGLVQIAEAPGPVASFAAFDALGRLSSTTVAGATRTPTFDAQGRLTGLTRSTPVPNLAPKLTTLSDSSFLGPLASTSEMSGSAVLPGGQTARLTRTFNGLGQLKTWKVAAPTAGPEVALAFDNDGLLTSAGAASPLVLGRSTQTGLVTTATFGSLGETFGWSNYGEPSTYAVKVGAETTARFELVYERDTAGRVARRIETTRATAGATPVVVTYEYQYDDAGRLIEEKKIAGTTTVTGWWYDANGNRFPDAAKAKASYDAQDRLLWLEPSANLRYEYGYTPNGELATRTTKVNGVTTESAGFTYDVEGNLTSATLGAVTVSYEVDALNRRVRRKSTTNAAAQVFLWDGPRLVAELDGNGALKATFVYATQGHSPDLMIRTSGGTHTAYRLLKDQLGSIRQVVATNGAVVMRLDYDAWGNITSEFQDPAVPTAGFPLQPFGFAGGLHDRETGLVRFGARDYDPKSGRWTTKDVSRFAGGSNLYSYCESSPPNLIDQSGHFPEDRYYAMSADEVADANQASGLAAGLFLITSAAFAPEAGITLWGALQNLGPTGRILTALLGGPAGASLNRAIPERSQPGQLVGDAALAGRCVEKTQQSIATFGGEPILAPSFNHWANRLPNGMVHDATLRASLVERGVYVGDVSRTQTMFSYNEWISLVSRVK